MKIGSRFHLLSLAGAVFFWGSAAPAVAEDGAMLVAPKEIHSGGSSALTLTTFNAQTHEPVSRRAIIRLLDGNRIVETQTPDDVRNPACHRHPFGYRRVHSSTRSSGR